MQVCRLDSKHTSMQVCKKRGLTQSLTQTIQEYSARSSIHGISYAFDRELNVDVDDDDDDEDDDDNGYDDDPWDQLA